VPVHERPRSAKYFKDVAVWSQLCALRDAEERQRVEKFNPEAQIAQYLEEQERYGEHEGCTTWSHGRLAREQDIMRMKVDVEQLINICGDNYGTGVSQWEASWEKYMHAGCNLELALGMMFC
jgi:hypothetical protein